MIGLARGYSWPPFEKGHTVSLRHGAWSPRLVNPLASELVEQLLAMTMLPTYGQRSGAQPCGRGHAARPASSLADYLIDLVGSDRLGDLDDPKVSAAYRLLDRFEAQAVQQHGRLGLDPLSAAKLGKDVALGRQADAATELTRMREEHERALQELKWQTQ
jgi:hypothetical protein